MSLPSDEGSGVCGRLSSSSRSHSRYSSPLTIGSFSDQVIKAADAESSTSGSAASKHSSHDAVVETPVTTHIQAKTYQIPYSIHSDRLATDRLNIDFILDDTSKGRIKVWPKSMEEYLSLHYKNIIPMIKSQCVDGDVIFIAHSLMTTLHINTAQCPHGLLCDICIFSSTRPLMVLTLDTSYIQGRHKIAYNAKLTKALTEVTRKKGEFSLTHGVLHVETQFISETILKDNIAKIVKNSSFGATGPSLQMNEEKFKLAIQAFCEMLCSCHHSVIEQLYFADIMSNMFIELFEERQSIEIISTVKDPALLLIREMVFRLSCSDIPCKILCHQQYSKDLRYLSRMPGVEVVEEERESSLTLTSKRIKNAKWTFVIPQGKDGDSEGVYSFNRKDGDSEAQEKHAKETDVIDKEACIVKSIIDKSSKEKEITGAERRQLEDAVRFSLKQFESRAVTFFGDLLDGGYRVDHIADYNAFMEDYLMQCFRQRYLQLTHTRQDAPDDDLDTHLHSIRKLTPLLSRELRLEKPFLDRLIQHDVMSEAGRESIMGRDTPTSRNKAFITYLCGNFTSKTFKAQFLPLLSEDHETLANRLEDEMERLTIASKKTEKCTFCKMRDTVNIRRLMDALLQMNEISASLRGELSTSALPNTVKWTQLFKHVKSVEIIMKALEQKNAHLYREFIRKGHSCLECTCEASESQRLSDIVVSDADNPEGDVANLADFDEDDRNSISSIVMQSTKEDGN